MTTQAQICMSFDGRTFDQDRDGSRLRYQLDAVYHLMKDAAWRSLSEIGAKTGFPEASISARLRDLRKAKFGGHTVRRRPANIQGVFRVWEYQLIACYRCV